MAHCPFCHGEVHEDLAIFGGTCPHCFGEIPGEDAPTDPGEEVKAQIEAEVQQQRRKRAMMPVFVAAPVALLVVALAVWSLQPEPEVEPLTFDDLTFEMDFQAYDPSMDEAEEVEEAEAVARRTPSRGVPSARRLRDVGGGPSVDDLSDRLSDAQAADDDGSRRRVRQGELPRGDRDLSLEPEMRNSAGLDMDITVDAKREAALLTDTSDISAATTDMLKARVPRLQLCYERSLKSNEELRGTWRLSFTIDTDGRVKKPSAVGQQMSDDRMERCMVDKMARWSINGRLKQAQPVSFPVDFKPRG